MWKLRLYAILSFIHFQSSAVRAQLYSAPGPEAQLRTTVDTYEPCQHAMPSPTSAQRSIS